jgi:hypothetical protein
MFLAGLIMKEVVKTKQGMVSSLTILVRFAPLTFGIAVFNIIFLWGIATIATKHDCDPLVTNRYAKAGDLGGL